MRNIYNESMRQKIQTYQNVEMRRFPSSRLDAIGSQVRKLDAGGTRPDARPRSTAEVSSPVYPSSSVADGRPNEEAKTRCGLRGSGISFGDAHEVENRMQIAMEGYDSKMTYAKTKHKTDIPMGPISAGTRKRYSGSWGDESPSPSYNKSQRGWVSEKKD